MSSGSKLRGTKEQSTKERGTKKFQRVLAIVALPYFIVLLVITSATLFVYPSAAAWMSQYNYSKLLDNYEDLINDVQPEREAQLKAAREYNEALKSGAQLLPGERIPTGSGTFIDKKSQSDGHLWRYKDILAADEMGLMGRIRINKIDVDLPIYHGTDDATLLLGAGHLEGTSLPLGGASTHTVVTAHRGLASAELFSRLNEIEKGDNFTFEIFGDVLTYKVFDVKVVDPDDRDGVKAVADKDLATLVTCTPLGINSHRILVTGERVLPTPEKDLHNANNSSDLPRFPWWAIAYVGVILGALAWAVVQTKQALNPQKYRERRSRRGKMKKV